MIMDDLGTYFQVYFPLCEWGFPICTIQTIVNINLFSRGLHIASKLINDSNLSMKIEPLIAVSVEWSGKWTVKKVTEYGAMLIL